MSLEWNVVGRIGGFFFGDFVKGVLREDVGGGIFWGRGYRVFCGTLLWILIF